MDKNKIGSIFLVAALALAGIGISYAGFTDTITIYGEVNTATVELELIDYSGTHVYKIYDVTHGFGPNPGWVDSGILDKYSPTEEILIFKGRTSLIPSEFEVEDWFDGNANVERVSWAYAEEGNNDKEVDLVYHNLFPCVDFTADFIFKYAGSIPAKLWAEYEITEDDDDLLAMLLDEGAITLEAYGSGGIFGETDTSLEIGVQVHGGEEIYLALTIHVPQNNKYQGLSGKFTATITALQWNEDYDEDECIPPLTPIDPLPAHESINIAYGQTLKLEFKTGHEFGETIQINIYLSKDPDPINNHEFYRLSEHHSMIGYTLISAIYILDTELLPDTTYFWQVVVEADCGSETFGPVWQFTTKLEGECEEEITLSKNVWNETSQHWENFIIVDQGDTVTFNISIYLPEDACTTVDGNVTDKLPAGLAYIDDSTNITAIFSDDSVEYFEVEPWKGTYGTSGVRLIWNETNMGGPMVLQPGTQLHITFDAEVTAIAGSLTNTAELYATYGEEDPTLKTEDTAIVDVYFEETFTEIWTIDDLYAIRNNPSGNYILMRNLDFWWFEEYYVDDGVGAEAKMIENTTGEGWLPIGEFTPWENRFSGTFDGQGFKIKGLFINRGSSNYVGLFGVTNGAVIKNVGLINNDVTGRNYVGGLIGFSSGSSSVSNCYATGPVTGTFSGSNVGGLIGQNDISSIVEDCYATGQVNGPNGNSYVGGLIGNNNYGTVSNCYATGDVNGNYWAGGLIGRNGGTVEDCYATAKVTIPQSGGNIYGGGLIGYTAVGSTVSNSYATGDVTGLIVGGLIGASQGTVEKCFATGLVTGGTTVGGLVGINTGAGTVQDSFYDTETTVQSDTGKGTPKTTAEMQDFDTFNNAGWNIEKIGDWTNEIWKIDDGNDYPRLFWEL